MQIQFIHMVFNIEPSPYCQQLSKQQDVSTSLELNNNSTRSALYETEGKFKFLESENKQLRRDKDLLVDHVAELQRQVRLAFTGLITGDSLYLRTYL